MCDYAQLEARLLALGASNYTQQELRILAQCWAEQCEHSAPATAPATWTHRFFTSLVALRACGVLDVAPVESANARRAEGQQKRWKKEKSG